MLNTHFEFRRKNNRPDNFFPINQTPKIHLFELISVVWAINCQNRCSFQFADVAKKKQQKSPKRFSWCRATLGGRISIKTWHILRSRRLVNHGKCHIDRWRALHFTRFWKSHFPKEGEVVLYRCIALPDILRLFLRCMRGSNRSTDFLAWWLKHADRPKKVLFKRLNRKKLVLGNLSYPKNCNRNLAWEIEKWECRITFER